MNKIIAKIQELVDALRDLNSQVVMLESSLERLEKIVFDKVEKSDG